MKRARHRRCNIFGTEGAIAAMIGLFLVYYSFGVRDLCTEGAHPEGALYSLLLRGDTKKFQCRALNALAFRPRSNALFVISIIYFIMGISFLIRSITFNPNQIGYFGGKVWWQNLRIFHGFLYLLVFILMIFVLQKSLVIKLLIFDLIIGLLFFILEKTF